MNIRIAAFTVAALSAAAGRVSAQDHITIVAEVRQSDFPPGVFIADGIILALEDRDARGGIADPLHVVSVRDYIPLVPVIREEPVPNDFAEFSDYLTKIAAEVDYAIGDPSLAGSVAGIVGPTFSDEAFFMIPALAGRLLMVSPSNTSPRITKPAFGGPLGTSYGRVIQSDEVQARNAARWAAALIPTPSRVVILDDGTEFSSFSVEAFADEAASEGLAVVGRSRLSFAPGPRADFRVTDRFGRLPGKADLPIAIASSFLPLVKRVNPDVIYLGGFPFLGQSVMKQLRAAGWNGTFLASDPYLDPFVTDRAGSAAQGMLVASAAIAPSALLGDAAAWRPRFVSRFNLSADDFALNGLFAAYAYVATEAVLDSIQRAVDSGHSPFDRAAVTAEFFKTRRASSLIGAFSIDANGDTTSTLGSGYQVTGDQFVPITLLGSPGP